MKETQHLASAALGLIIILAILWDGFETMVLTRTVTRRWRFTAAYYLLTRATLYRTVRKFIPEGRRHGILTAYAPLSLLVLLAFWAGLLILGFALLDYGMKIGVSAKSANDFGDYLYFSGVTFLTLGYGDLVPQTALGRIFAVFEAASGFLFLALVISYLPVFYGAVRSREIMIIQLDARAGSIPSGHQLLRRHAEYGCMGELKATLKEYERWGAELLEAYLSYPVLCFYRSQHDDQSWLLTLVAILDACALIENGIESDEPWVAPLRMQAHNTLAMLRHVLVDLAYILRLKPNFHRESRLTPELADWIRDDLRMSGLVLRRGPEAQGRMQKMVDLYEPYAHGIGEDLIMSLPAFGRADTLKDNWEIAAWDGERHTENDHA